MRPPSKNKKNKKRIPAATRPCAAPLSLATLLLLFLEAAAPRLLAQGPLTPPGPPGATGRSLEQIEPRTPIAASTTTISISQPGSYYLTGNIAVTTGNGISITADNVTLDLNGFSITSKSASPNGTGISVQGAVQQVTLSNGHVSGTTIFSLFTFSGGGFLHGIAATASTARNIRVLNVSVAGVGGNGIDLGGSTSSSVITGSTVRIAAGVGIRGGAVSDSAALQCGGANAIQAGTVANSIGTLTVPGTAILATDPTLPDIADRVTATRAAAEARTILPGGTTGHIITQSGSYVLAGNLTLAAGDGIRIEADDVTLDLNGFTIASTTVSPAAGDGVALVGARSNVMIRNGFIRGGTTYTLGGPFSGGGFANGVHSTSSAARNCTAENISVTGVKTDAIFLHNITGGESVIRNCIASIAGRDGLRAGSVLDSRAATCAEFAIAGDVIDNCRGISTDFIGIFGDTISNSQGISNNLSAASSASGIEGTVITNCYGTCGGPGKGIEGSMVTNSYGLCSGTGIGLEATNIATHSRGHAQNGTGLKAAIAVACRAQGTPALDVTNTYQMP